MIKWTIPIILVTSLMISSDTYADDSIDGSVRQFLDHNQWRDMNVPASDGKALYDIIVENGYTRALEIGTSTGHSGIWIAWALSKTGGKLITLEIDASRHKTAVKNFGEAGVRDYIDARLGDAHVITQELAGPFDFIFSDADKSWNTRYAQILLPKLRVGGCYVTHNISPPAGNQRRGFARQGELNNDYVTYMMNQPDIETTFVTTGAGMSISYKK